MVETSERWKSRSKPGSREGKQFKAQENDNRIDLAMMEIKAFREWLSFPNGGNDNQIKMRTIGSDPHFQELSFSYHFEIGLLSLLNLYHKFGTKVRHRVAQIRPTNISEGYSRSASYKL